MIVVKTVYSLSFQTRHFSNFAPNGAYGWSLEKFSELDEQNTAGRRIVIMTPKGEVWVAYGPLKFLGVSYEDPRLDLDTIFDPATKRNMPLIRFNKNMEALIEKTIAAIPREYSDLRIRNQTFLAWLRHLAAGGSDQDTAWANANPPV